MLLWHERLFDTPVMSLQTGAQLGMAKEPILNPKDLRLVAFYCEGPMVEARPAVLHTSDIREFGELGMIVNDSDDLMPLDGLVRLQEIINYHFDLLGKRVVDTTGHKLGKINSYIVDTKTFEVAKFSVRRPLLRAINEAELIIDRSQIRKITNDEIVVEAPTVEERTPVTEALRAPAEFHNPFRGAQPEHSDTQK